MFKKWTTTNWFHASALTAFISFISYIQADMQLGNEGAWWTSTVVFGLAAIYAMARAIKGGYKGKQD